MTIRIVLADDHPVVLAGLGELLQAEPDLHVIARVADGDAALGAVRVHRPDVLVLDLRMPVRDGLSVLRALREAGDATRVVVLTAVSGDDAVEAACLGAMGVVLKDAAPTQLIQCIRDVHAGRRWLDPSVATRAIARLAERGGVGATSGTLTPRELEIAKLAADGMPSKAIARRLGIAEGTVKLHLHNVYEKLAVSGRFALARALDPPSRS